MPTPSPVIYRAHYESRHFTFEAFASDSADAVVGVLRALAHHAATHPDVHPDFLGEAMTAIEISPPIYLGLGYRDHEPCDEAGRVAQFGGGR